MYKTTQAAIRNSVCGLVADGRWVVVGVWAVGGGDNMIMFYIEV
jgi:hypothetical protein